MDRNDAAIAMMEFAEQMGDYRVLAAQIREIGPRLERSENRAAGERYRELIKRTAPGFEYERTHGRGSLPNLDHPTVRHFIAGGRLIPAGEIQAAERHRSSTFPEA